MKFNKIPIGTKFYIQYFDRITLITINSKLQKIEGKRTMSVKATFWEYQIKASNITDKGLHKKEATYTKTSLNIILKNYDVIYHPDHGCDERLQRQCLAVILEQNGNKIL